MNSTETETKSQNDEVCPACGQSPASEFLDNTEDKDGAKVSRYISNCGSHGDHIDVQSLIEGRWLSPETWQKLAKEKFGIDETYFAEIRDDLERQEAVHENGGLVSAAIIRWPLPAGFHGMYSAEEVLGSDDLPPWERQPSTAHQRKSVDPADTSRPVIIEEA